MPRLSKLWLLVGLFIGAVLVGYGYLKGQVSDTRCYASVVCTSCLGIHEIAPELTFQQKAELTNIQNPVELMLFTAEGCLDCPKAHDFVESIHQVTQGKVLYTELDIRENWALVEEYDIGYVPTVVIGDRKLEGLGEIREGLVPAILELSKGQS